MKFKEIHNNTPPCHQFVTKMKYIQKRNTQRRHAEHIKNTCTNLDNDSISVKADPL